MHEVSRGPSQTADAISLVDRTDPRADWEVILRWRGGTVAGFREVRGLRVGASAAMKRQRIERGYEPITLERGVSFDPEFLGWLSSVWSWPPAQEGEQPGDSRCDLELELYDMNGALQGRLVAFRCWASEIERPENQSAGDTAECAEPAQLARVTLQHDGWKLRTR